MTFVGTIFGELLQSDSFCTNVRIMCHANNTLWAACQVDEALVEKPVAPGGATGGVEFEAMNYAVSSV